MVSIRTWTAPREAARARAIVVLPTPGRPLNTTSITRAYAKRTHTVPARALARSFEGSYCFHAGPGFADAQAPSMFIAYCVLAVVYFAMLMFSEITKLELHPQAVQIIHELIGVPLGLFPVLAACEFAVAVG